MTNREKFKEVFGFYPDVVTCVAPHKICLIEIEKGNDCFNNCLFEDWWDKEYKACFEIKDGLDE